VRLLLAGRESDLVRGLYQRMARASEEERYEEAARCRDLIATVEQLRERQKMAAAAGEDVDVLGFHQEGPLLAVDLLHMRGGRAVDRREFFWEDLADFQAREFFSSLLKQLYLEQPYLPSEIHVPVDFEDREVLEEILTESRHRPVHILAPQAGRKRALLELVAKNARHSFERRFRIAQPQTREVVENLGEVLDLPQPPQRIEAFDVSHIQGSDIVASLVVWEAGRMNKSEYRKYIMRTVTRSDDFASMKEVVGRRYRRLLEEHRPLPDLILVDGGIGQLHAAAAALEELQIINQPLASIAKREEIIYVCGREHEPIALDRHSPALHLIQLIRDEAHRFAVTFHRARRSGRELTTSLLRVPGIGAKTAQKLLASFGSVDAIERLSVDELSQVLRPALAKLLKDYLTVPLE
jgi:excinuclease ABC subunit C